MAISDYIRNVFFDITSKDKFSFITEMTKRIAIAHPGVPDFSETLLDRERMKTTILKHEIAFPRSFNTPVPYIVGGIAIVRDGMEWDEGNRVKLVLILAANGKLAKTYMKTLVDITHILGSTQHRNGLVNAKNADQALSILNSVA